MSQENPGSEARDAQGLHLAPCPVVGVGASAGGLEAFQTFLSHAPADAGLAYVLVQHLDPNHESMLAELLARRTTMPVRQVRDGDSVEPNCVLLIPPNASLVIENARLRLSEFAEPRGFRRPIDVFFRSLAADQGANAACVVLSGTGADGSEGLRVVKEAGGLTLVQEPGSAKYDGMPKSAVATGLVDKVLSAAEMPAALRDYFDRAQAGVVNLPDVTDFLLDVCEQLRRRLGHDFSQYKRSTMLRRIQRRMQVVGAVNAGDYLTRLKDHPDEAELLFRDLLINVTCFFRDSEAFDMLRREVIPSILEGKGAHDTVRIWTAGCSSGEEAYSIAILVAEALSRAKVRPIVQIFATDIDEPMLDRARAARYPHAAVRDVPVELLDRYFYVTDEEYALSQGIRDMVRVSNHNLLKDPPFSRIDLMVCRNLLIYLNGALQQRLIPVFHYSLRPQGWLFLGSAENIAARGDLFETVDNSAKIYRRKGVQRQSVPMPLAVDPAVRALDDADALAGRASRGKLDTASRRVLERYAPAHVVVNGENEIVHASTRTGKYFELAEGAPSNNIADLAKRGLRAPVRSLLDVARKSGKRTVKRDVKVKAEEDAFAVDITADPLGEQQILLVFQDTGTLADAEAAVDESTDGDRAQQLEEELDETRTRLRTTVEELETSNEELKSSNEEMMSMNEELQSANEELATVNEELKNKVDQLARANSDLQNFIESTQVPTIFLDRTLRIRRFTPAARVLYRFQDGDQDYGRPLSDIVSRADVAQVVKASERVLATGEPVEEELIVKDGRESYVLRALPYLDLTGHITGLIIVFTDVTRIRQTQADLARNISLARLQSEEIVRLYQTAPVGMALVDRNGRFIRFNQHFSRLTGSTGEDYVGRTMADSIPALAPRLDAPIAEVFERADDVLNLAVTVRLKEDDAPQDFLIDLYPYDEDGVIIAVGLIIKDVTELRRLEKELRRLMDELQHRVKNTLATVVSIVNQTAAGRKNGTEFIETLKRRISALAATHDLLTKQDWRSASLRAILEAELEPFDHKDRITLRGPAAVMLPPKHALCLTMTVHELATNAAKYGALSEVGGTLDVHWVVSEDDEGRALTLTWVEKLATPLSSTKVKSSFGAKLIKRAVVHDLAGTSTYELTAQGVSCTLSFRF